MPETSVSQITPVLLCGGSGTRLWPLSRKSYPKQFAQLVGKQSLFQSCIDRLSGAGFADPIIITGSDFRFIVSEQVDEMGVKSPTILLEPEGRNTAPAVLAAAIQVAKSDPNGLLLVAPSDHQVPDVQAFRKAIFAGAEVAQKGQLITFGICPDRPETGYGYLELAEKPTDLSPRPHDLVQFVEKPDEARAAEMLASGNYLWNAGIFLFSAKSILEAFKAHAPHLIDPVTAAVENAETDIGFTRLASDPWSKAEDISIDYAVMERAKNLSVVPFDGDWSDLGDWGAVWRALDPNDKGNAQSGPVTEIDCSNTLLRSEDKNQQLVGIGLDNIVAVAMKDAVLVADKSQAQNVRKAVDVLKANEVKQATAFPVDHRPWGYFETLVLGSRFQVKRIVVHPGAALSLQSHVHRSEHWIVVEGTARVTVDEEVKLVAENQSVYIPLGAVHRMENPGKVPMVLIEVQTGSYLGEDDIIRYEDIYARS